MGSSSSKPAFPVPRPYDSSSKSGRWSFSMKSLSKKGKGRSEKYDDFIIPKFPPSTAAPGMYAGFPYYQQVPSTYPSTYPAYYAPVQMAIVQPIGVQQPVLAMPPTYLPIAAYPTAQGPLQPVIPPAPAAQRAPSAQMPVPAIQRAGTAPMSMPAPSSTPAPISLPVPAHAMPSAPLSGPPSGQSQMPQPYPAHVHDDPPSTRMPQAHPPGSHSSGRPRSPVIPNPVIPPPPVTNSVAPDSGRLRLTDFYRPAGYPPHAPRSTVDEPVRPPSAAPPGRTPFVPNMQMPTPHQVPTSNNPLPPPPANVWDTSPYRQVLENLPNELPSLIDLPHRSDVLVDEPEPIPRPSSRLAGIFGGRDKGKKPLRGLFRSRSDSVHDMPVPNAGPSRHARSRTMTSIFIPPPAAGPINMPEPGAPNTSMPTPAPAYGPPLRFDHTGEFAGFVNHSPHRVMYKNKMYPTALHLLEAMKFTHQPSLQERIRTCKDVNDMYPLSASLHEHVRPDWGHVFMKIMEDVLYLKFKQHPGLRALLLGTGFVDIIYADENQYWGEGPSGDGTNELGKALCRIRERLRQEGET